MAGRVLAGGVERSGIEVDQIAECGCDGVGGGGHPFTVVLAAVSGNPLVIVGCRCEAGMVEATDTLFAERYRALSSRDARFDGQFIAGVHTTGIYCRPSCPATTPHARNVSFYRTAAAAHEAGLRACKRCQPDAVPGSPTGTSPTTWPAGRCGSSPTE